MNYKNCEKCGKEIRISNYSRHFKACIEQTKINEVRKRYLEGATKKQLYKEKWCTKAKLDEILKDIQRTQSEIMIGRSKGWNRFSYAEEFFEKILINNGYKKNEDFVREFPFSFYRVDFYFLKLKLAVEIDGKQHEKRMNFDRKKDLYINKKGVRVLRIVWKDFIKTPKTRIKQILRILSNTKHTEIRVEDYTLYQCKRLKIEQEKKIKDSQLKENKINEKLNKYLNDANLLLGKDSICLKLTKKWKKTRHFVKRFFNKHFPNECITRKTCICGKVLHNESTFKKHKLTCSKIRNKQIKAKVIKEFHKYFVSIEELAKRCNVYESVVTTILKQNNLWSNKCC